MKNIWIWISVILFIILIYVLYTKRGVCYNLPTNSDPEVFGPYYWKALHDITHRIPCPACRKDGVPLMIFMHDTINYKIGKPFFDLENFKKWQKYISEIPIT